MAQRGDICINWQFAEDKQDFKMTQELCLWKTHLKYWSSTTITPTPTRVPTRRWSSQSRGKTWVLYQRPPWRTSWWTWHLEPSWQLHRTTRNFSLPLAGRRIDLAWPRRTKNRRTNRHVFNAPLLNHVRYPHPWPWRCFKSRGTTMMPALTRVLGKATPQHHPIPTSAQICDDLTSRRRRNNTPWRILGTRRNAISDSNRFRQHSQACLREEIPLREVRALNKVLHTKQDTTHFLFVDGDTIQIDC